MDTITPFIFFLILAIGLIAAELFIFQLSIFWCLLIGLGALVAMFAALIYPEAGWLAIVPVFVVSSAVIAVVAYKPFKQWQNKPGKLSGNDAIGQSVKVVETISKETQGKVLWSGTEWAANLGENDVEAIDVGDTAYIERLEGIRLIVRK